jgi:hypothetical protein
MADFVQISIKISWASIASWDRSRIIVVEPKPQCSTDPAPILCSEFPEHCMK